MASGKAASCHIVSTASNVQFPLSSRSASPKPWIIGQTKKRAR